MVAASDFETTVPLREKKTHAKLAIDVTYIKNKLTNVSHEPKIIFKK